MITLLGGLFHCIISLVFSRTPFRSYFASAIISCLVYPSAVIVWFSVVALPLVMCVGNSGLMATLGVGDARSLRPQCYAYASANKCTSYGKFPTQSFHPSCSQFSSNLSFHHLITINHDLYLRLTQTLCLPLSRSTPLHKILTVNHYLCVDYFQQCDRVKFRVTARDSLFPHPSIINIYEINEKLTPELQPP